MLVGVEMPKMIENLAGVDLKGRIKDSENAKVES